MKKHIIIFVLFVLCNSLMAQLKLLNSIKLTNYRCAAIHPNGKEVLASDYFGNLKYMNIETGEVHKDYKMGESMAFFKINTQGTKLLFRNNAGKLKLLDMTTNEIENLGINVSGNVFSFGIEDDEIYIVEQKRKLKVYNITSKSVTHEYEYMANSFSSIDINTEQRLILGGYKEIKVFDSANRDILYYFKNNGAVKSIYKSTLNRKLLYTLVVNNTNSPTKSVLKLFDIENRQYLMDLNFDNQKGAIIAFDINRAGTRMITLSNKTLNAWDISTLNNTAIETPKTTVENIRLELIPEEKLLITYDAIGNQPLKNVSVNIIRANGDIIVPKSLSGDLGNTVSSGRDKKIYWDMKAEGIDLQGEDISVKILQD